jgi:hypothetical protein
MPEQVKVAVVYYSSTGTVYQLAKSIVEGAEKAGAEVRLRKVHELAPDEAIAANAGWASHVAEAQYVAEATAEDILWADAVIFGSLRQHRQPAQAVHRHARRPMVARAARRQGLQRLHRDQYRARWPGVDHPRSVQHR